MFTAGTVAAFTTHTRDEISDFASPDFGGRRVASDTIGQRFAADNVTEIVNVFVNRIGMLSGSQPECASRNVGSVSAGL